MGSSAPPPPSTLPPVNTPVSRSSPLPEFAYTGRKLGTAMLLYVLGVVAVITLEPFTFARRATVSILWFANWFDIVANVALFVPAGFLFALARSATDDDSLAARRHVLRLATLVGFITSASIELAQLFEPSRYPSPTDVATNTLGAALGAWLFGRAARRFGADTPLVGRLALELPLIGLVYLLVPLLSLAALTVAQVAPPSAAWMPLPRGLGLIALGLFGGTLLGHVQRRHFGPARATTPAQTALVAAGWFALGALPALATAPAVFGIGTAAAGLAAWRYGVTPDGFVAVNRRFELQTLRRGAPWLAAYLALIPLSEPSMLPERLETLDVLHAVESLAAFTVLGYVLAEAWGRLELRYRYTAWRVGLVAVGAAVVTALLRHVAAPVSAGGLALHVLAAGYGGWIYHLQRAHVRALIAARPAADVVAAPEPTRVRLSA